MCAALRLQVGHAYRQRRKLGMFYMENENISFEHFMGFPEKMSLRADVVDMVKSLNSVWKAAQCLKDEVGMGSVINMCMPTITQVSHRLTHNVMTFSLALVLTQTPRVMALSCLEIV